jgi:hypothetical protein
VNLFGQEQTVELSTMFERCGFQATDWVDIPAWILFTASVPTTGGGLLSGQKQSVGSAQGADFYLRRIQTSGFNDATNGPQVQLQIKFPDGRYLFGGNSSTQLSNLAGVFAPNVLGLIKPERHCPAGSQFTIDLLNVTSTFNPPGAAITVTILFVGVYRYRLQGGCQ